MRTMCALVAVMAFLINGCGKTESKPATNEPQAAAKPAPLPVPSPAADPASAAPKATESAASAPTPPATPGIPGPPKEWPRPERIPAASVPTADTPEGVVEQVSQALADGKYQILWEILPESRQKELQAVLLEFTDRMDAGVYDHTVAIVEFTTRMIEKHKERLLAHPMIVQFGVEKEKMAAAMDAVVVAGKALLDSELYSLAELRSMDLPAFLSTTVPKIVAAAPQLAAAIPAEQAAMLGPIEQAFGIAGSLKGVKASRVSGDDSTAVVRVEIEGSEPVDVEFVKVEGKWVPKQLEDQWPMVLDQFRGWLTMVPDKNNPKAVSDATVTLMFAWGAMKALHEKNTDEEFNKQLDIVMSLLRATNVLPKPQDKKAGEESQPPAEPPKP